ncbi:MAG: hypothetical protein ACLFR8_12790 [Alkalispirochaeta sp.]
MEKTLGEIRLYATDPTINGLLRRKSDHSVGYRRHFNQSEDFFLRLGREFQVPSFQIHHDIQHITPDAGYIDTLRGYLDQLQQMIPGVFEGLTYYFDPAEVLRPGFFQLYRVSGEYYLYLLKLDLVYRPQNHTVVGKGSNDTTPVYRTANLIVEANVVPLRDVRREGEKTTGFLIDQLISDTWIGETGRGYFVQGIWIDTDLNKFFTKLFVPEGKRIYPYYPYTSKYRTICHNPINLEARSRREALPHLHRARTFLTPYLDEIQSVLREREFAPDLPLFRELKARIPEEWTHFLDDFALDMYLNDDEMREYEVLENGPER